MKEKQAFEQQKQSAEETSKLAPIVEEDHPSTEKSSLSGKSAEPLIPKRRVTIVDNYNKGAGDAGDLHTTVGV